MPEPSERTETLASAATIRRMVAARKFARTPEKRAELTGRLGRDLGQVAEGARPPELGGVPQTGELFDREIVDRMGPAFYRDVFSPGIAAAIAERKTYESIRDGLRVPWNLRRIGSAES